MSELTQAGVGKWELNLSDNTMRWTSVSRELHEVSDDFVPTVEKLLQFYPEKQSRNKLSQAIDEATVHGYPFDLCMTMTTAQGTNRWIRTMGKAEYEQGERVRLSGTFQGIQDDDDKERERRLQENETLLKETQALAKIGSWQWYPSTNQVIWSDQLYKILGLNPEDHSGYVHDLYQFIHPDDVEKVKRVANQAVAERRAIPTEYRIIASDGTLKYIRGEGDQILGEEDNLVKLFGTLQDISEQVRPKMQLDQFWNISTDLLCIANLDGYFLKVNPRWKEVLGYSEEELKTRPFIEFVHPGDRPATLAEVALLAQGHTTIAFVNRYRTKDGSYRWFQWNSGVNVDQGLLYANARDITSQIEADQALKKYAQQLELKNKELEQFVYIASHDLQEPLRTISSLADMLKDKYSVKLDQHGNKIIKYIADASHRMQSLIKGLLDYGRMGQNAEVTKVDCNTLLEIVLADLALFIQEKEAKVEIEALPQIEGYYTELRSLFQNLISNAIKFRKPDVTPEVRVNAQQRQGEWVFSVQDNGIGMEKKNLEKIFLIFQRLHSRKVYNGSGIGLAHCRKIVNLHGGEIWVESKPNEGSTFYFTIPIAA